MKKSSLLCLFILCLFACSNEEVIQRDIDFIEVDERSRLIKEEAILAGLTKVLTIDHARLAKKEKAELGASKVDLFSDVNINTSLILENTLVGLDLPFRIISYAQAGVVKTMYTDAIFLQKRHSLQESDNLQRYKEKLVAITKGVPDAKPVNTQALEPNYGITKIVSDFNFETTLENIKRDVLKEGDTIWFINLDYKAEAEKIGKDLPNATLLIFGAPGPGATAMLDFPSIGLDAFGQKVLVYSEQGKVMVAYNDIVALSKLHYQNNAIAHRVINFRLGKTLSNAVEK